MSRDLRIRDGHAVKADADRPLGVAVGVVDRDAESLRRLGPLVLQVLGGGDDRDRHDLAQVKQAPRDRQGICRLARAGRGNDQEVALSYPEILFVSSLLPATKT